MKCVIKQPLFAAPVSLPTRERGLKSAGGAVGVEEYKSLPTRERGLKYTLVPVERCRDHVAPYAGAWIEIWRFLRALSIILSLPTRERGLK